VLKVVVVDFDVDQVVVLLVIELVAYTVDVV